MKLTTLLLTFLLGAGVAFAQENAATVAANDTLTANYEGTLKSPDQHVSLELKSGGANIWGRFKNGETVLETTQGSLKNGILSLTFEQKASLSARLDGDKVVGDWRAGTEKRDLELTRVAPAAATAPAAAVPAAAAPAAAAPINLSGDWEAVADANGQPFPFFLTLKVDGEKVTGGSSSQLGETTIKEGMWKDGKLTFQLEGTNGTIAMSATVIDGKLTGEFDYAGQLSGKWVAVRKN